MRQLTATLLFFTVLCCQVNADEKPLVSRITSVGLFKNGLAVIKRAVTVNGPGTYCVEDIPTPVHGTFWIESDAKIVTRLTKRMVEVPIRQSTMIDFQEELAGKEITIYFAQHGIPQVTGKVVEIEPVLGDRSWNRTYRQQRHGSWRSSSRNSVNRQSGSMRMLVLQTENGCCYVDPSRIAYLRAKGTGKTARKQLKDILLFSVTDMKKKQAAIQISYLAKGIAWVPSYRVDISDPKNLVIKQKAVIKNELENINGVEIQLISGFPSVQFANVTSPLSLNTTWANFFRQLNQRYQAGHSSMSNVVSQQAVMTHQGDDTDFAAIPTGEGVDLHYQNIGKQTLEEGDSLALEVASAKASYQSIVEWIVPDTRRADGRYIEEHERNQDPEKYKDAAWDAVRFRNPFQFPMTTAPAMIVSDGRFNGQRMSCWVNSGEQTTLHITKALSIRTQNIENEVKGARAEASLWGRRYYKVTVQGELRADNYRNEPITLVIRRRFSGDLVEADRSPSCILLEEGVYSVNKRNQLTWNLTLKPGEKVNLKYLYTVLVRHY